MAKKRQTFGKMQRERERLEKRERKKERKEEKRIEAAADAQAEAFGYPVPEEEVEDATPADLDWEPELEKADAQSG